MDQSQTAARSAARPNTVYFYGTCLIDQFQPAAGLAGLKLLQAEGLDVIYPQGQSCCGQPPLVAGYADEARQVAWAQVRLFSRDLPIVVPSGSCATTMKRHYPDLFRGTEQQAEVEDFSARVYELNQFLVDVLGVRLVDHGAPIQVTWLGSCQAIRSLDLDRCAHVLLRQLDNVTLIELTRDFECCGFGGGLGQHRPEIAATLGAQRIAAVSATRAELAIFDDCGCMLTLENGLAEAVPPTRPRHIAEFLWDRSHD